MMPEVNSGMPLLSKTVGRRVGLGVALGGRVNCTTGGALGLFVLRTTGWGVRLKVGTWAAGSRLGLGLGVWLAVGLGVLLGRGVNIGFRGISGGVGVVMKIGGVGSACNAPPQAAKLPPAKIIITA